MIVQPPVRGSRQPTPTIDPVKLRLGVLGVVVLAAFIALFSRLWFLQVMAADFYVEEAKDNRVRLIQSEPPRGRILDRKGRVLVDNRRTLAVTVERETLDDRESRAVVLRRLSKLLGMPTRRLRENLRDGTVSPYKPVPVATDVPERFATEIKENQEDFPGVNLDKLPVRIYPQGDTAAHILGYVNEISQEGLESRHFARSRPRYQPGDIVGQSGVEYTYDRFLRGRPRVEKVVVNSGGDVVARRLLREERPGADLVLGIDIEVQKLVERALEAGIRTNQGAGYQAPAGAAVVMDPSTGHVVAMASYPDYDPRLAVDGFSKREFASLGARTTNDPDDDAFLNRAIQAQRSPASTFKVVTAGAALATGIADAYTQLPCPGSVAYPPDDPAPQVFNNWTSVDFGTMDFTRSLEVSCDTFYYKLGWDMEMRFNTPPDMKESFQKYARRAGLGHETGIDLPNELPGNIPDRAWCREMRRKKLACLAGEGDGWLPGYSVNMAIGQGDVTTTPLQMAVTYSAIASRGSVWEPRVASALARFDSLGNRDKTLREIEPRVTTRLTLEDIEYSVIEEGLSKVVSTGEGTARPAFSGFPLESYPVVGKTGTSELGETDLQDAWFISYGPRGAPKYTIAIYLEKAGHGGESAAPVARQIWEGIFNLDSDTNVQLGQDESG